MLLLTALDDDVLLKILDAFLLNREGAMIVWKHVCKNWLRLAKTTLDHERSWLRAMGASTNLVALARTWKAMPLKSNPDSKLEDEHILRAIVRGKHMRTLYEIFFSLGPGWAGADRDLWARDTQLMTPLAHLRDNPLRLDPLLGTAIETGSLAMVQLLVMLCHFQVGKGAAMHAAKKGHLAIFEWMLDLQTHFTESPMPYEWTITLPFTLAGEASPRVLSDEIDLADEQWFEPIDWGQLNFYPDTFAADGGNLDIVKRCYAEMQLAREHRPDLAEEYESDPLWEHHSHTCMIAAQGDHPHICEWALTQLAACEDFDESDMAECLDSCLNEACQVHAFKAVEFLAKRQGEKFDPSELLFVVNYDFEVSKFLMETMNVPVEYGMMAGAVSRQLYGPNFSDMEYIHSKGCPKDIPEDFREGEAYAHRGHSVDAYMAALCNDSVQFPTRLALIKWLHERGYSLEGSYAMEVALKDDDLPMVGALMALGVPFDADFFTSDRWNQYETRADQCYESYAVVEWARNQGWEIPKDKWPNGPTVPNTLAE